MRPIQTVSSISDEPLARDSDADEAVYEDETESIGEGEDSQATAIGNTPNPPPPIRNVIGSRLPKQLTPKKATSEDLIYQASSVLKSVATNRRQPSPALPPTPIREDDTDELFGKTMTRLIKGVTNEMQKEMAKIECQEIIFRYRFASQQHLPPPAFSAASNPSTASSSSISPPLYSNNPYPDSAASNHRTYPSRYSPYPASQTIPYNNNNDHNTTKNVTSPMQQSQNDTYINYEKFRCYLFSVKGATEN